MKKLVSLLLALLMLVPMSAAFAEDSMIVDEPIVLTAAVMDSVYRLNDMNDKEYYKQIARETGIGFEFEVVRDWETGINMKIVGEELPDIVMTKFKSLPSNLDYFADLTDLIYEYAPSLVKAMEEEPSLKASLTQADGRIYQLPTQHTYFYDSAMGGLMWINTKWLANVGMEMPTNLDELYAVLCAFRDQDANGNGNPNDEVALGFAENNWAGKIDDLFGCFGVLNNVWSGYTEINDDHKVVFEPQHEGYFKALQWLNKLYTENLLDAEGFSQTSDQYQARIAQDAYGVVIHYNPNSYLKDCFVPMAPIMGENGTTLMDGNLGLSAMSQGMAVSVDSKYAKEIVQLWEYINSDTARKVSGRYGEQGVSWNFVEGSTEDWILADYDSTPPEGYEFWDQYIQTVGETGEGGFAFFSMADWEHNVSELTVREAAIKSYRPYFHQNRYKYMPLEEELANELNLIFVEIDAYVKSFYADSVINGIDDAGWAAHLDHLNKLNADRYVELKQMSYDAFLELTK